MNTSIITQLADAVGARRDSLAALRERIAELLAPIPVGAILADETGEVCRIIRVCTGASQWSNRTWQVTIKGKGALTPARKLLCDDLDNSHWDGNNMHRRSSEPTCRFRNGEIEDELSYESGQITREFAARLPAAIATYLVECERETEANNSAAATIAAAAALSGESR